MKIESGKVVGHGIVIFVVGGDWRAKVVFLFQAIRFRTPKKGDVYRFRLVSLSILGIEFLH